MSFIWNVSHLNSNSEGGVESVRLDCRKTQTINGQEHHVHFGYVTALDPGPDPTLESFIPYADLTEATVLGWVHENTAVKEQIEAQLEAELEELRNAPTPQALPW